MIAKMRHLDIKENYELPYSNREALNRLRVNLELCGSQYKTLLITSSIPSEGKSYISFHLWRLLAEAGKRVVLVDGDIRRSALRTQYKMSVTDGGESYGLVNFLAGQVGLNDVLYETSVPNGYVIPVFRTMSNPSVLLQNDALPAMIKALSAECDYIIVDTPPLDSVADGLQMAPVCDGALLVVRSGFTPRRLINNSIRQLASAKCELLGIALNRIEADKNPYYYKYTRYGYGRYYRKYYYGYYHYNKYY